MKVAYLVLVTAGVALLSACSLVYDAGAFRSSDVPSAGADGAIGVEAPSKDADTGDAMVGDATIVQDASTIDRSVYPPATRWWEPGAGGNGHGYLVVVSPGTIPWEVARDAAKSIARGHLVTLTSLAELELVQALLADTPDAFRSTGLRRDGPWVGLSRQGAGLVAFAWVNGEPYAHEPKMWSSGEPTNEPPGEPYVHLLGFTTSKSVLLDDTSAAAPTTSYVVEIE